MAKKTFKAQTASAMLGLSYDALWRTVQESGIEVMRQENGPKARVYSIEKLYDLAAWRASKSGTAGTKPLGRQIVMTVYVPKGGVGKTTISSNLACVLSMMGLRVLVIDLDFQSNLTLSFGYDSELTDEDLAKENLSAEQRIDYHFGHLIPGFNSTAVPLRDILKMPYGPNGPHLIPADTYLDRLDSFLAVESLRSAGADLAFSRLLVNGRKPGGEFADYDVIMFDAAPAKNQMTRNALLASDYVVAPISLEKYSTKSISYLAAVLREMQENAGRCPELVIVGNFFDPSRTRVLDQMGLIRNTYGGAWLEALIKRSEDFPKTLSALDVEMPLCLSKPTSSAAVDIREVASRLLNRFGIGR